MSSAKSAAKRAVGHPVLSIGMRTRLRGFLGTGVLVGWLAALGATTVAAWLHEVGTRQLLRQPDVPATVIGPAIGQWWVVATASLMLVAVPAVVAGAVAGARERHTAIPWHVSLVRPRSIVAGHLLAAWAFVLLLAVTSTPFAALAWGLGGIGPAELGAGLAASVAIGAVTACVALAVSAHSRRTITALLLTYLLLAVVVAGSAVLHAASDPSAGRRSVDAGLLVNPVVAAADAAGSTPDSSGARHGAPFALPGAADRPEAHLAALVHRGARAAGPTTAAWPVTAAGGLLVALLALVLADLGVRRRRFR